MNYLLAIAIPLLFLGSFVFALYRKVHVYESFTQGMKGVIPLIVSIFPYIAAVTMLCKLLEVSGLNTTLAKCLQPIFRFSGIPEEIAPLVFIKPLSGSGSIAVITEILEKYGVDSYIARCACVVYGSSETVFYIGAVYFAGIKRKKLNTALAISLFSYLASVVLACFLCKIM
jgi:spore maturation protein B